MIFTNSRGVFQVVRKRIVARRDNPHEIVVLEIETMQPIRTHPESAS
jgi:hypothetical protein